MIGRIAIALGLALVFLGQVVSSGLLTAWFIVRPGHRPASGLIRISFSGVSPTGAAMLGSMITLTPGTTTIDIDVERGEMLLHLLDASAPDTVAHEIHQRFELPMRRIFPKGGAS